MIGEVAELLGITPKAIRHYEKLGLIEKPRRSEPGYRLYTADDLLRLHQIKRLRSLGLSLDRTKGILGASGSHVELGSVLQALLGEVESHIEQLERRRDLLKRMLAGDDPSEEGGEPYMLELARRHVGGRFREVAPGVLEQEKRFWATLDAFRWPRGYEEFQEALVLYLADHPEEYEELLALEERLVALADQIEDFREVEQLAEDYAAYFEKSPLPERLSRGVAWESGPLETALSGVALNAMSPAQKKCMELLQERLAEAGAER
ncbi:MAG: MerR family transcriptional regulator [Actinomycetota bacterium]|nr:MerR family transcriptional regulator [Actinomycetota bacterium]